MKLTTRAWGERGRPIVLLIHGTGSCWREWREVGPWFAGSGWRAVAVDLSAHGDSPSGHRKLSLDHVVSDVHETAEGMLCTGEGVDVILGHSLGAIVAARLSVLYPHLASRLVLVDPPGTRSRDYVQRADEVRNRVAQVKADPQSWVRKLLGENPWMDEEQARWRVEAHLSNDSEAVVSLVRSLAQIDTVKILGEVRGPTLLVLASEEKGSTLPEEERTAAVRAMKDAEVSTLPTGHIVHLEAPKDFLAVLKNWLVRTEHRSGHIE